MNRERAWDKASARPDSDSEHGPSKDGFEVWIAAGVRAVCQSHEDVPHPENPSKIDFLP